LLWPRHLYMRRFEVERDAYAILNDSGFRYSLLTYYISVDSQVAQLRNLHFHSIRAYNFNGQTVDVDRASPWIYYTARKSDSHQA
jgi:hypothetical protein